MATGAAPRRASVEENTAWDIPCSLKKSESGIDHNGIVKKKYGDKKPNNGRFKHLDESENHTRYKNYHTRIVNIS